MPKHASLVHSSSPPVTGATIFICEKCGKRADDDKHLSHRLASKLKRSLKERFSKGYIRIVLTSCMDLCPDDRIAVSVQPVDSAVPPSFWEVDIGDIQASSDALCATIAEAIRS